MTEIEARRQYQERLVQASDILGAGFTNDEQRAAFDRTMAEMDGLYAPFRWAERADFQAVSDLTPDAESFSVEDWSRRDLDEWDRRLAAALREKR